MQAISLLSRSEAPRYSALPAANGSGSLIAGRQDSLSGRPSCRIHPVGKGWGLELERSSAWLAGLDQQGDFRFFRSLAGAVGFAEARGLDYQIIRPTTLFLANRRRFPASHRASRPSPAFMRSSSS